MAIDPESLYLQLGQMVAEMPDMDDNADHDTIPSATLSWLGKAAPLVRSASGVGDSLAFNSACDNLAAGSRYVEANKIKAIIHRALGNAEQNAPVATKGAYIAVGAAFDVLKAISKVMSEAKSDVLIVDPYMNSKVLTDFAPEAPAGVMVRLLTDIHSTSHATMQPAVSRWAAQHGTTRSLEARLTPPKALHDRLILIDNKLAWLLTQSLKDFAARSPASVVRLDPDLANLKVQWYEQLWLSSSPVV